MAYYPFRDRLRFPLWKVLLPVCLFQILQSLFHGSAMLAGGDGRAVEFAFAPVYMGIYFFSVKDDRSKLLFLYLFVMNYTMILRGAATFLEARLFYDPFPNFISWRSTLLSLAALAVSVPFMLRIFANARDKVLNTNAPVFWRTMWLIPAFTTTIAMIFTNDFQAEQVRSFRFLFARVLLLLCIFVVYTILLDALDGIRRQAALAEQAETQEQLLNLQKTQHKQLIQYMEEMKAVRHDLRQHLSVIEACLEREDIDGLKEYLQAYKEKLPADIHGTFTPNFALNAVCTHFAEEARKYGIDYDVSLDIPERLPINEPEVCALLGNLLENAVDACREVCGSVPFIKARGTWEDGQMVIPWTTPAGRLRSGRENGSGQRSGTASGSAPGWSGGRRNAAGERRNLFMKTACFILPFCCMDSRTSFPSWTGRAGPAPWPSGRQW